MHPDLAQSEIPFEQLLLEGFTRNGAHGTALLLAVSGGRDSMALLFGAVRLSEKLQIPRIVVAHMNHGLRGDSGAKDATFVRTACEELRLEIITEELPAGLLCQSASGSIEEAARDARYEFLRRTAERYHLPLIATAHHAADQAETILHNIVRGTGLRGLRGIPERRRISDTCEIIRPMLAVSGDIISSYMVEAGRAFVCDETNETMQFTRNRIRQQLLTTLRSDFNIKADQHLVRLAEQTSELLEAVDTVAAAALEEATLERRTEHCRIDSAKLRAHGEPLIRHALTLLWIRQEWSRRQMNRSHWIQLSGMIMGLPPTAADLPGGIRAERRGNQMIVLSRIH